MSAHSFLSPKCLTRKSSGIHERGVFAKENIKKGELVAIWGGYILSLKDTLSKKVCSKEIVDKWYSVQIYNDFYISPRFKENIDGTDMFNHSCNPNIGVKGQIVLVARKDIKKGEELCFDYETTDTEDCKFICECGAKNCRRKITGSAWKDPKFQKANKGFLSYYIEEKIRKFKNKKIVA